MILLILIINKELTIASKFINSALEKEIVKKNKKSIIQEVVDNSTSPVPKQQSKPDTNNIKISDVISLQRSVDIEKALKTIDNDDSLFKPLDLMNDNTAKEKMIETLKEVIPGYGASVWYERAERAISEDEGFWGETARILKNAFTAGMGGDKKSDQKIVYMLKEVNQKFMDKMEKEGNSDFIMGKTLAAIDESKTEYDYKKSTVTFFIKDSEQSEEDGKLKKGHKIEVKFTDLTGRYSKNYKNITQSAFEKSGPAYEEFKKDRIKLAKEMLRDCEKYQDKIKVYKGENALIEAIGGDLAKSIKNNTLRNNKDLNHKMNYNHNDDRAVEITIRKDNEKLGLKQGDKIIVSPTPYHFFGADKQTRYKEAMYILENPNEHKDKIHIKKQGEKNKSKLEDFLKENNSQENNNEVQNTKIKDIKKVQNTKIKDIKSLLPAKDNIDLESNFSIYRTKDGMKIQDSVKTVALEALYKTDYILRAETKTM